MSLNISSPSIYELLDGLLKQMSVELEKSQSFFLQNRPAAVPSYVYEGINRVSLNMPKIRKQVEALEEERSSLSALANIGQFVNSSLELDEVLQIVMDTIIRLTDAERGFLMLKNEEGTLHMQIARNMEKESLDPSEFNISRTVTMRVATEGKPVLTTNAQEDPRFTGQESVVAYNLRSILCVPLMAKGELIGVIYADNRIRSGIFSQQDLGLLSAFADQAAVAIENARLFDSVLKTLAEVTELKNLMDNVFASIASGVLTADIQQRIMMCNQAAASILGMESIDLVGHDMKEMLSTLHPVLSPYFQEVLRTDLPLLNLEGRPIFPVRGPVDLHFNLSPLKDVDQTTQGVAIVMEDLTEKKRLEAQRRLFERMVSPAVIDQLDPDSLQLGGRRAEITILFADIRGFTSFSEGLSPEKLVTVLNHYLAAAADAVLGEEGTIDKFMGDAVMAWFNAPVPQADHVLRAARAALGIRKALQKLQGEIKPEYQLSFGVGIHVGEAVLGLVGTEKRLEYTAIGDCVNTTKRIQENSGPGQILISDEAYQRIASHVVVQEVAPVVAKGKREPLRVVELMDLRHA
jgi:PAS domain S-box-containing protein